MHKKDWIWLLSSAAGLALSYLLCRFVFFPLHGMKQWPTLLAAAGLAVLSVSWPFQKRAVMVMTVIGYLGGYALGEIFHTHGLDPGGGGTNNLWFIWTVAFWVSIVTGAVMDAVRRKRK